ncbi:MAG: hypothetical protein MJ069_02595 [Salinivirgaceae bacterium]|nr:hypothetical protein [Salinivirgaceae bacterium]
MKHSLLLILLLLLLTQTTTFAQVGSPTYAPALADSIYVDNTIRDTVKLTTTFATIYQNNQGRYIAVDAEGNEVDITAKVGSKSRNFQLKVAAFFINN